MPHLLSPKPATFPHSSLQTLILLIEAVTRETHLSHAVFFSLPPYTLSSFV